MFQTHVPLHVLDLPSSLIVQEMKGKLSTTRVVRSQTGVSEENK
jgi:hypothetical protein